MQKILFGVLIGGGTVLSGGSLLTCKPGTTPTTIVEAGVQPVVTEACTWLEGVTDNTTVLSICATAEEVLLIVGILTPLLAKEGAPDAACTILPNTKICATKKQLGPAILQIVERRRARLLLDAGADASR
jgi:hypothetical protein